MANHADSFVLYHQQCDAPEDELEKVIFIFMAGSMKVELQHTGAVKRRTEKKRGAYH